MERRKCGWLTVSCIVLGIGLVTGCDREGSMPESDVTEVATPAPGLLRNIMLGLGDDMNEISRGLWLGDLAVVEAAASAIAGHPHVSETERVRIQGVLGAGFSDFVRADRVVHDAALRLAAAAAARSPASALGELADLQAGCVGCHQAFRERLRQASRDAR